MKKINICVLLLVLVVISSVDAKNPPKDKYKLPEFYYQEGCAALKKGKIEIAKDNFQKGIEKNILFTPFPTDWSRDVAISMEKDISKAEAFENNGIEWKVYYYKGLLESNLVFSRSFACFIVKGKVASENKEFAIQSLEKSISIFDNYQSHVVLSILKPEDEEAELNKIVNSALAISNFESASSAEYDIGRIYETREQFEIAIQHYEKSNEYWKKWLNNENGNCLLAIREANEKIKIMPQIKAKGYKSYREYEEYLAEKKRRQEELERLEKQREERKKKLMAKRCSWKNLYVYLVMGNYGNSIPLEIGDVIEIPKNTSILIDVDVVNGEYLYLFSAIGYDGLSKCAYLRTRRQISALGASGTGNVIQEKLKVKYEGVANYKSGVLVQKTYVFSLVE